MQGKRARPAPHPELETMLASPLGMVSLEELPWHFRLCRLTFEYERPPDLEDGPRLPAAIRGALGEPLKQIARNRRQSGQIGYSAFDAFFADHRAMEESWHAPKPFVIWCATSGGAIRVEITLFGEACDFRDDVAEAMDRIMMPQVTGGYGGISLASGGRARRVWNRTGVRCEIRSAYPAQPLRRNFVLAAATPVAMGAGETAKGGFDDLFFSLLARLSGFALWNRLALGPDLGFAQLRALARQIRAEPLFGQRAVSFLRKSRSFGASEKWETGQFPVLRISDYPDQLWPAFVLGTLIHFGYNAPQGLGRYVICEP